MTSPQPSPTYTRTTVRLSPVHIAAVKAATNIVELVGHSIELRRQGRIFCGRCPWHASKSGRSFQIRPEEQTWRCWGCNVGGDVFAFVRRFFNLNFSDAAIFLARRVGIDLAKAPSRELTQRVAMQVERDRLAREQREAERGEVLRLGAVLAGARRLYRVASSRLLEIENGSKVRFDDEPEVCWESMRLANDEAREADVGYTLVAFGTPAQRKDWLQSPSKREAMIREALASGFVRGEKGIHRVPAA
jgi:hypothetical protein